MAKRYLRPILLFGSHRVIDAAEELKAPITKRLDNDIVKMREEGILRLNIEAAYVLP